MRKRHEILAGAGLGFALGMFVGMSTASVVAIMVTSLAALLAAFFGLSAGATDSAKILRIAAFAVACPIAVIAGVSIRVHDWLEPSLKQQISEWTGAGYTADQARSLVVFRQLGLIPEGQKAVDPPKSRTGLFASTSESSSAVLAECSRLSARRLPKPEERISAMRDAGGAWKTLADAVDKSDAEHRGAVLEAAYGLVCP
jgi:hypothetical protein